MTIMRVLYSQQLLVLCVMALLAADSWAEVKLNSVSINVVLQADGSARFTEVWDVDVNDTEHSELYQARGKRSIGQIVNLTVSDGDTKLTTVEPWDTDADDKTGRCGINPTKSGYEMCWGIGAPGHHRYTLNYTATSVVRPYGSERVMMRLQVFHAGGLPPQRVNATITRADSTLKDSEVLETEVNSGNVEGFFDHGRFELNTLRPMVKGDYMTLYAMFPASAFGALDISATSTDISADELSSPMMTDKTTSTYEGSWWTRFWDFYDQWPLLTLFSMLGGILALFYIIKKIAIALA